MSLSLSKRLRRRLRHGGAGSIFYRREMQSVRKAPVKRRRRRAAVRSLPPPRATTSEFSEGTLRIYCDGACSKNGRRGAVAGWGVHFPDGEFEDMYGALDGPLQTNQRAELTAILKALSVLDAATYTPPQCVIYTDSMYSINCVTVWIKSWKKNNWMNASRKPVANDDLIRAIDFLLGRHRVAFVHVRGHANDPFNDAADELARLGASRQSQQLHVLDKTLNTIF